MPEPRQQDILAAADIGELANEETAELLAWARTTLHAEIEAPVLGDAAVRSPAPPPMALLQAQWRERPGLRALVRAAADLSDGQAERSLVAWTLREASRSREWRREAGGMLPFAEFFALME